MKWFLHYLFLFLCFGDFVWSYRKYKFQAGEISNSKLRKLSQEPLIKKTILNNQLKWLASHAKFHTFHGHNNLKLQAMYVENIYADKTPIIFCPGFAEPMAKYTKFIRHWYDLGHSVYTFDLRGQGFSDVIEYDEGNVIHLNSFQDYVIDLKLFVNQVEERLTQIDNHYDQRYTNNNNDNINNKNNNNNDNNNNDNNNNNDDNDDNDDNDNKNNNDNDNNNSNNNDNDNNNNNNNESRNSNTNNNSNSYAAKK